MRGVARDEAPDARIAGLDILAARIATLILRYGAGATVMRVE